MHCDVERLHQRAGVPAKALLTWYQRVAVTEISPRAASNRRVVVVRREQEAGAFAHEPLGG